MNIEAIDHQMISGNPAAGSLESVPQAPQAAPFTPPAETGHPSRFDEFVPSEAPKGTGLYQPVRGEDGSLSVVFDAPQEVRSAAAPAEEPKDDSSDSEEECSSTRCTVNTDRVDREIEQLKKDVRQLEQELQSAQEPDQRKESRLLALEAELSLKNNDAYRKQHASYSFE